ncbi:MAG: SMC-Scp complex subunit ScpB [Candidatus Doudnabacteria bacterium RIFCSPLOWO2_02_FULL_49_13]|uniref:SMC-Scp complex subunit ScpB n=1 Tax=Candidatus Doudnabacteria bacterium RIFCSPHIGHO2_12_FULL_48_16 TaxID=1817838 RepID=A0A1F5PLT9_9BACT|nr:MAG: SMC-Scp complex subunit ScpB [Candidatus Doudnabacteria bacterium RIFCSPHIGHO2_02_FULL_49_24]OGE88840.1 MAG: SMC-Scp complex subunit ScpB [Candidatus Doudnabacteria bacterium RIFCSPHIGHO2_01_FULL_50_67]OGE90640.1 MAG: SMC-Scp complex subunit ScpB [Candidatus Doudnabacteria bacterium RIFCSPHIGHO2_12_FULL_48_16]OGE96971.1 MAG: SMC-Scp complex subunit ScpB [Candidatus Doudnabacteria bacterium RIFCSPLOWO2_01_FULL_49_40]OGF02472.1 MAG: SMC-Scp complex subunit ScpB [Candidatus Doudnabacteria 
MNRLKSQILSILFVASKPVGLKELADALETEEAQIKQAVTEIVAGNQNSGIILLAHNNKLQLSSNPDNSSQVKKFLSLELREKLTDASLETLAIILYKQPVSKAEIENIRGVNSQYSLRHLLIRGLIEKIPSPSDKRIQLYKTTLEFMQHLGIKDMKELPDFDELTKGIELSPKVESFQALENNAI